MFALLINVLWAVGIAAVFVVTLVVVLYIFDLLTYRPFETTGTVKPGANARKWPASLGHRPYAAADVPANIDTIIIGSGEGGLSCGATLAQHFGHTVVVLEQHQVVGGGAHCFAVDGKAKWRFDAGLHVSVPVHELALQLASGAAAPPVEFTHLFDKHRVSDYLGLGGAAPGWGKPEAEGTMPVRPGPLQGPLRIEHDFVTRFPKHRDAIRRYFALSDTIQKQFGVFIASAILPSWLRALVLRLPLMRLWFRWNKKTMTEALLELFPGDAPDDILVRTYLSGLWLNAGAPPSRGSFFMQVAVMGGWQRIGVAYPAGGPEKIAMALVDVIENSPVPKANGRVFISTPVEAILRDGSGAACGVRLANGDELRTKTVVSGCGYRATERMLAKQTDGAPPLPPAPHALKTGQSAGFVLVNIMLNGTAEEMGIAAPWLWLQPADAANKFDGLVGEQAFFADPLGVPVSQIPCGITFSVKDSGEGNAAAAGRTNHHCQILVPADWAWFDQHDPMYPGSLLKNGSRHGPPHVSRKDQESYDELKAKWQDRMMEVLFHHFPKTKDHVAHVDISTPQTMAHYLWTEGGAAVGLDVTPPRFVDLDEIAELDIRHPRVPNLYRAGQDYLMCGQVCAATGGMIAALRIVGPVGVVRFVLRAARLLRGNTTIPKLKRELGETDLPKGKAA